MSYDILDPFSMDLNFDNFNFNQDNLFPSPKSETNVISDIARQSLSGVCTGKRAHEISSDNQERDYKRRRVDQSKTEPLFDEPLNFDSFDFFSDDTDSTSFAALMSDQAGNREIPSPSSNKSNASTEKPLIRKKSENQPEIPPDPETLKMWREQSETRRMWRARCPITSNAIFQQARLMKAQRESKIWASRQNLIPPLNKTSANAVFQLKNPNGTEEVVAYFKMGKNYEQSIGVMEKLMWDFAVLMGLENQLVPTGMTEIRGLPHFDGGSGKGLFWKDEGTLELNTKLQNGLTGSIQPAQEGCQLKDYEQEILKNPYRGQISKQEIIDATLASLVLGSYDLHYENILIDETGKIKFFDNGRSLPNSNGFILRENKLVSAYRNALLGLPQSKETLTPDELFLISLKVNNWLNTIPTVQAFFSLPATKAILQKLPNDWLSVNQALNALQQRLQNLSIALKSEHPPQTILELVISAIPDYKFCYALQLAAFLACKSYSQSDINDLLNTTHNWVGYYTITDLAETLTNQGYFVSQIKSACDDPNLSWNDICNFIIVRMLQRRNDKDLLMQQLALRSCVDNKR